MGGEKRRRLESFVRFYECSYTNQKEKKRAYQALSISRKRRRKALCLYLNATKKPWKKRPISPTTQDKPTVRWRLQEKKKDKPTILKGGRRRPCLAPWNSDNYRLISTVRSMAKGKEKGRASSTTTQSTKREKKKRTSSSAHYYQL